MNYNVFGDIINQIRIAIVAILMLCIIVEMLKKNDKLFRNCLLMVSVLYLFGLIYFTQFIGNRNNITGISIRFPMPFTKAIINEGFGLVAKRSLLNLLLFIPFGYLLPNVFVSFGKKITWWQVMVFGYVTSLIIETSQLLFHHGVYELDDLVKNTLGSLIGFLLYIIIYKILARNSG